MAGRIRIEPYKPLDVHTPPVPGGGYIQVDASAGTFGSSFLGSLGRETGQASPSFLPAQLARDDEAVVKDADVRLGEAEQALLFDPQTGYLNTQGQGAVDQAATVLNAYSQAQARESEGLFNDAQRHMLEDLAQRRLTTFTEQVHHHSATQRLRWHDTTSDRRIAQMQADAGFNWSDDALLRRALGTVRAEVRDKAERNGWASPLTEAELHHQTSRTLAAAIEAAVERDPDRARSLRTRYGQHIDAADRAALDALLNEAQTRQRAQQASAAILNTTPPDGQAPTLQWQLHHAAAITDPAVRAATMRTLHAAAASAESRARTLAEQVLARALKDGLTNSSQIPIREWVALDAKHREAIETRLDHNAAGTEPAPNPALVDELATQLTEAPGTFARRDLVPSVAHLPLPQWQRFRDLQAGLRRNDSTAQEEAYAVKRGLQLAAKMLPDHPPIEIATNYRAELVEEIATERRSTGRWPDDAAIWNMLLRRVPPEDQKVELLQNRFRPNLGSTPTELENMQERMEKLRRDLEIDQVAKMTPGGRATGAGRLPGTGKSLTGTGATISGGRSARTGAAAAKNVPDGRNSGTTSTAGSRNNGGGAPAPNEPASKASTTYSAPGTAAGRIVGDVSSGDVRRPQTPTGQPRRGHHYVTQEKYNSLGLPREAYKVFERATTGPLVKGSHYYDHLHRAYNAAVAEEVDGWLKINQIDPGKMNKPQAEELLDYIKNHQRPAIRDYLRYLDENRKQSLMRSLRETRGLA
jgi:hypothetical protein